MYVSISVWCSRPRCPSWASLGLFFLVQIPLLRTSDKGDLVITTQTQYSNYVMLACYCCCVYDLKFLTQVRAVAICAAMGATDFSAYLSALKCMFSLWWQINFVIYLQNWLLWCSIRTVLPWVQLLCVGWIWSASLRANKSWFFILLAFIYL